MTLAGLSGQPQWAPRRWTSWKAGEVSPGDGRRGGDREEEQEEGEGGGRWEEEEEEGRGPRGKRLVVIMEQESLLHLRDHEIHLFIVCHASSSCRTLLLRT